MELWLTLRFRGAPLGLRDRFPPELAFIIRQLRSLDGPEVPPSERISTAYLRVTPEQAEGIIAWGRVRTVDGRTLLASATYEERWRAHEIPDGAVVELVRPSSLDAPTVLGRGRSHLARWACSHCDRIRWEQVAPLELALDEPADVELVHRARPELLLTEAGELVATSRLRSLLEGQGLGTRPVVGTRSWIQVEPQGEVPLAAGRPLEVRGPTCPGCGRAPLDRWTAPEAPYDVRVIRTVPWGLSGALPAGVSLATSEQRIGFAGTIRGTASHATGAPIDVDLHPGLVAAQGAPVLLASAALVRALADAHAGGLELRPVRSALAGRTGIPVQAASC